MIYFEKVEGNTLADNSPVHTEKADTGILNIRCLIFRFPDINVTKPFIPGELLVPYDANPKELGYKKLANGLWAIPASDVTDALQKMEKHHVATNSKS